MPNKKISCDTWRIALQTIIETNRNYSVLKCQPSILSNLWVELIRERIRLQSYTGYFEL